MLVACQIVACVAIHDPSATYVSWVEYERHLNKLASDEFEGRKPGTPGEQKTVAYLQQQFRELGLRPGNGNQFIQQVPLIEISPRPTSTLRFSTPSGEQAARLGEDLLVVSRRVSEHVSVERSPLVFVGYGVVAPEHGWNDYAGIDMRGKTALILVNDPGFATDDPALFRGRAMTYYGRWTYKFEEAARQGADAALVVHEAAPAGYPWVSLVNSPATLQIDPDALGQRERVLKVQGWIHLDRTKALLAAAGQDFEALKASANQRGFAPVSLSAHATMRLESSIRRSNSSNVIARIPGTHRAGEYVLYMAHWDHLGLAAGTGGDTILNGAVDNATGVAGLLAIAHTFQGQSERPKRTVVFMATTGEEAGLLGSAFYAENPIYPLGRTVAALNIDALVFGGPTRDVSVIGFGASELEEYLAVAAARQDRVLVPEPRPEQGLYFRSDHLPLARKGVPALYFKPGVDDREYGKELGQRRQDDYVARRYHRPQDEYTPGTDLRGNIQDIELMLQVGRRLANESAFPNWYPESEFRAIRDRSIQKAAMP